MLLAGPAEALTNEFTVVITPAEIKTLLGGRKARLVTYVADQKGRVGPRAIYLLDFSREPVVPEKVADDFYWDFDKGYSDPFISPDGTRFVYGNAQKQIVVRELKAGGKSRAVVPEGYDARWWVHPRTGEEYIIYSDMVSTRNATMENHGKGTLIQKLKKGDCEADGPPKVLIANLRLAEGRTPSGRFIFGITPGFALAEFEDPLATENAKVKIISVRPGGSLCNGCVVQDESQGGRALWEGKLHDKIFCATWNNGQQQGNPLPRPNDSQAPSGFQLADVLAPEWSNHPDYMTAAWALVDGRKTWRAPWVFKVSSQTWVRVTDLGWHSHLWVAPESAPNAAASAPAAAEKNSSAAATPAKSPAPATVSWPNSLTGALVWTGTRGAISLNARKPDASPMFQTGQELLLGGLAILGPHGEMVLWNGSFTSEPLGRKIAGFCAESGEATVQLVFQPGSRNAASAGTIFSLGAKGAPPLLSVAQDRDGLVLSFTGADKKTLTAPLGAVAAGKAVHLGVTCGAGTLIAYVNGNETAKLDGASPTGWSDAILAFGNDADGRQPWEGRIGAMAVFCRRLSPAEMGDDAKSLLKMTAQYPAIRRSRVRVRLLEASPTPAPGQDAYFRAYAVNRYAIEDGDSDLVAKKQLFIAQWVWLDKTPLQASRLQVGRSCELEIEPLSAHPWMEGERSFEAALTDLNAPVFVDVGRPERRP